MEVLGCGCLLGVALALPLAIIVAVTVGKQKSMLQDVDLEQLSPGDVARWQTYVDQLAGNKPLSAEQIAHVKRWLGL